MIYVSFKWSIISILSICRLKVRRRLCLKVRKATAIFYVTIAVRQVKLHVNIVRYSQSMYETDC